MAILGIDLGTTNSCVSVIQEGEHIVIPNEEGSTTTPSVVAFAKNGERIVGASAKRQLLINPSNSFFAVKRLIGRKVDSDNIKKFIEFSPFSIVPDKHDNACVKGSGRKVYSVQEISSIILEKLKNIAQNHLDSEVAEAVITVPAHFNHIQRQATKDAGTIAGLKVRKIINEPTAAALAYGIDQQDSITIAVYDLGGGTFDITILSIEKGVFTVLSTNGDTYLGGYDFDLKLVEYVIEQFKDESGIDLRKDALALQKINQECEKAKQDLSYVEEVDIKLPFIAKDETGPKHLELKLTKTKLEELVNDLVDRTEDPCQKAIKEAALEAEDIDKIILAGGMTRMPLVREKVKEIFGKYPDTDVNPDEVVSIGAALQGYIIENQSSNITLLDINPLSLGIETKGGLFTTLIGKGKTLPTKKNLMFTTTEDNQEFVNIHVLQGEREMAADNISLARFRIDIPPKPKGAAQIDITFELDEDCILGISVHDIETGYVKEVNIEESNRLSDSEIEKLVEESMQSKKIDTEKKELALLKNEADNSIYFANKILENSQYANNPEVIKAEVELKNNLKEVQEIVDKDDYNSLNTALQSLKEASTTFAKILYSQGTDEGTATETASLDVPPSGVDKKEEVIEEKAKETELSLDIPSSEGDEKEEVIEEKAKETELSLDIPSSEGDEKEEVIEEEAKETELSLDIPSSEGDEKEEAIEEETKETELSLDIPLSEGDEKEEVIEEKAKETELSLEIPLSEGDEKEEVKRTESSEKGTEDAAKTSESISAQD